MCINVGEKGKEIITESTRVCVYMYKEKIEWRERRTYMCVCFIIHVSSHPPFPYGFSSPFCFPPVRLNNSGETRERRRRDAGNACPPRDPASDPFISVAQLRSGLGGLSWRHNKAVRGCRYTLL